MFWHPPFGDPCVPCMVMCIIGPCDSDAFRAYFPDWRDMQGLFNFGTQTFSFSQTPQKHEACP